MTARLWSLAAALVLTITPGCIGTLEDDAAADEPLDNAAQDEMGAEVPPVAGTTPPPEVPMVELSVSTSGQYPINAGFDKATMEAASGAMVHITFTNSETLPLFGHDWVLEGVDGAATDTIGSGESTDVMFTAPAPGEYAYFCSIGDHRERGMEGTFTVT